MAKSLKQLMREDILAGLRGFIMNALSKGTQNQDGSVTISKENVKRWRQALEGPLKTSPKYIQDWTGQTADVLIKTIKKFKRDSMSKVEERDPRIDEIKQAFIEYCQDIRSFEYKPDNRKDVPLIKERLAEGHSADLIKDEFDWFLKDDVSRRLSPTISVALSRNVFTQFLANR